MTKKTRSIKPQEPEKSQHLIILIHNKNIHENQRKMTCIQWHQSIHTLRLVLALFSINSAASHYVDWVTCVPQACTFWYTGRHQTYLQGIHILETLEV